MRVGLCGAPIGTRPRERQLERLAAGGAITLFRRQRAAERLLALGLGLLELDVFTLEAASHSPYSNWMAPDVAALRGRLQNTLRFTPGPIADLVTTHTQDAERAAGGLFRREPAAWSTDPAVQKTIANRLGWMGSPQIVAAALPRLRAFADEVKRDGVTDVVLLGMGGSSLAPEVLRAILGVAPGWPRFHMLDSTDPAAVRATATPPATSLYLLASKSGTTIEPNSLAAHFQRTLTEAGVVDWARHFVAITDPDTALERRARADGFRDVFLNPADIGGRYSALSFFGMVPSALMGQDVEAIVHWGLAMLAASEPGYGEATSNPSVALGLALGAGAKAGRDKMTLVGPPQFEPFGLWVEQLIAESTGKNGVGVVPIAGEPVGPPQMYDRDRLFVRLRQGRSSTNDLAATGAPMVEIDIVEPAALGAEFVRWEIATAVAGALLHINPFDEPNVQQAKDATRVLLDTYKKDRALPVPRADSTLPGGTTLSLSESARKYASDGSADALLTTLRSGDYFAVLAYVSAGDEALARELLALRRAVRDRTHAATMFGYGPRYLHSTGQLHKGGPNTGVFLVISAGPAADVEIPGEPYSFGTLEHAQAIGDFQSLDATGRRAVFAHLPSPDAVHVRELAAALLEKC
jgi:glucose-6-phosphate isomerase